MKPSQVTAKEKEFFNKFAEDKDYDSLTPQGYQSIINAFNDLLGDKRISIKTAVDLGCGTGSFTRRFLKTEGISSLGVDIAYYAVQRAAGKKDGIHYIVSDINALGIKDNSMDLVIFSGCLHHFPDIAPCLGQAHRILKKGGALLSYDPHLYNPAMWLYRHPLSPFFSKTGRTDNERLMSKREMQRDLKQAGFRNIKATAISAVTISYLESARASKLLPIYNFFENALGKLPIANQIGSFLICYAEK